MVTLERSSLSAVRAGSGVAASSSAAALAFRSFMGTSTPEPCARALLRRARGSKSAGPPRSAWICYARRGVMDFDHKIIDAIPALAWCAQPGGAKEFLNRQWRGYTGLSVEEGLGWGWKTAIHPDDLSRLTGKWEALLAKAEPGATEARLRGSDGVYRWFLFRVEPLRDETGRVVKWYGTATDIEDRKRAESLCAAEKRTLEMIADGAGLKDTLDEVCR